MKKCPHCGEPLEKSEEWDYDLRTIYRNGKSTVLNFQEADLFNLLYENRGKLVSHEEILGALYGCRDVNAIDSLHVVVSKIRRKIRDNLGGGVTITNIPRWHSRGGYWLEWH